MEEPDDRSRRCLLKPSSMLGLAVAFRPATIAEAFADSQSNTAQKENTMTQTSATQAADKTTVRPFHVNVPEAELTGLRRRINSTRWPDRETVTDESQSTVQFFSDDPRSYRDGRHSRLVLWSLGIGIPILLAGSRIRRANHGAGRSAYVHQRRSPRRKSNGAALCRGDCRTASPAARLQLGRFYASRQGESRCDLGLEREEDRRQYMRVHQFGAQLLHAGAPGLAGQTGHAMGGLPSGCKPVSEAHNRQETPMFAKSIERHALRRRSD